MRNFFRKHKTEILNITVSGFIAGAGTALINLATQLNSQNDGDGLEPNVIGSLTGATILFFSSLYLMGRQDLCKSSAAGDDSSQQLVESKDTEDEKQQLSTYISLSACTGIIGGGMLLPLSLYLMNLASSFQREGDDSANLIFVNCNRTSIECYSDSTLVDLYVFSCKIISDKCESLCTDYFKYCSELNLIDDAELVNFVLGAITLMTGGYFLGRSCSLTNRSSIADNRYALMHDFPDEKHSLNSDTNRSTISPDV
jgi:hypothetical protein